MQRTISRTAFGDDQVKVTVRFDDIETVRGTIEARHRQIQFLQELLDTPALLTCDFEPFENLRMIHDGNRWVIWIDATVTKK